jgi:hypothetical protein
VIFNVALVASPAYMENTLSFGFNKPMSVLLGWVV